MELKHIILIITVCCYSHTVEAAPPCDSVMEYWYAYSNCSTQLFMTLERGGNGSESGASMVSSIRGMCGGSVDNYVTCLETKFNSCPADVKDLVAKKAIDYKNRLCTGGALKTIVKNSLDTMEQLFNYSSSAKKCHQATGNIQLVTETTHCYANSQFQGASVGYANKSITEALPALSKQYRRTLTCLRRVLKAHSTCTGEEIKALLLYYMVLLPWADVRDQDLQLKTSAKPRQGKRHTLAAFGDPHIVVFNDTKLRTCSAPGRQVYLENDFVSIVGNNKLVRSGSSATVIDQLDIQIMDKDGKVQAKYSAGNSLLPNSFEGGKAKVTIDSMEAEVKSVGRLLRIKASNAGIVIITARYNNMYPLLLIRGSESVFNASSGILVDGCVDMPRTVVGRRKRQTDCSSACSGAAGERKDACDFDCNTLGDAEFAKRTTEDLKAGETEAAVIDVELADDHNGAAMFHMSWMAFSLFILSILI